MPAPIYDTEAADNPLKQIEMPAYVGETKTVELRTSLPIDAATSKFVITLIKLSQETSE